MTLKQFSWVCNPETNLADVLCMGKHKLNDCTIVFKDSFLVLAPHLSTLSKYFPTGSEPSLQYSEDIHKFLSTLKEVFHPTRTHPVLDDYITTHDDVVKTIKDVV